MGAAVLARLAFPDANPIGQAGGIVEDDRCGLAARDQRNGIDVAFVSNVDPEHLTRALTGLDPATTLFIVTSKAFTTTETLRNAQAAREWLDDNMVVACVNLGFGPDDEPLVGDATMDGAADLVEIDGEAV